MPHPTQQPAPEASAVQRWPDLPQSIFRNPDEGPALDLDRLERHLHAHGLAFDRSRGARRLAGGLANFNYLISIDGKPWVLRRPPDGELPAGAHDMAREHFVLSRLSTTCALAPRSIHFCDERSVIGVPFQIIEFRRGLVVRGDDLSTVGKRADAGPKLAATLAETLASIHAVDLSRIGLQDFGKPQGFVTRAIEGWTRRGLRVAGESACASAIADIGAWLASQRVRTRPATLLHCDFKLDNCMLDESTFEVRTVVDWDMGTRGDPLFDVATLLSYWAQPGDPPCMHSLRQMPTASGALGSRAQMLERYASITGSDVSDFPVFRVLAMLKLSVVCLQLHERFLTGAVSDPRYAEFGVLGGEIAVHTLDIARGRAD